ncbi:MAG: hypothetical protein ACRDE5_09800 [Ginsengibacter sp.]
MLNIEAPVYQMNYYVNDVKKVLRWETLNASDNYIRKFKNVRR